MSAFPKLAAQLQQDHSIDKKDELHRCEDVIRRGLKLSLEVIDALATIRDHELFRLKGYDSFSEYATYEWQVGRRRLDQMIAARGVMNNLPETGTKPTKESQARELAKLTPELQSAVWTHAATLAETHGHKAPTAADIQEAAHDVLLQDLAEKVHQLSPEDRQAIVEGEDAKAVVEVVRDQAKQAKKDAVRKALAWTEKLHTLLMRIERNDFGKVPESVGAAAKAAALLVCVRGWLGPKRKTKGGE